MPLKGYSSSTLLLQLLFLVYNKTHPTLHQDAGFYNGIIIISWGSKGSGDGQFNGPTGIAVNSSGYVYVANYASPHRIQKFTYDGKFVGWIGKCTAGPNCDVAF